MRRTFLILAFLSAFGASDAAAKKLESLPFAFGDVWNAVVRFVVVDEGFAVVEKDGDAGYILFQFRPPGSKKEERGAIELVRHAERTEVLVSLPTMPAYYETQLLDRFVAKARQELRDARPPRAGSGPRKAVRYEDAGSP